jgi:hypothetical protein
MSYASWQNPVFLSELNDYQNGYVAGGVRVSSDENGILFSRSTPTKSDALWEARRNPDTGVFDQQRQLSELKNGGAQVYGSWMSEDKLRLYYAGGDPQSIGWSKRPIWMAIRSNPNASWQTTKRHNELEIQAFQTCCTLTADEKVIMWETATFGTGGLKRIFTATRPSILHNFSNLREAVELEAIPAYVPLISREGRTVYFRTRNSEGVWEQWMGHRDSLDMPFGQFSPIEINSNGVAIDPALSGDGKRIYYSHVPNETPSINNAGVYMSEWVDDSYADAIRNLQEARADEEQATRLIQGSSDKEQTALRILNTLSAGDIPDGISKKDLKKAVQSVRTALQTQQLIQKILVMNLRYLDSALGLLPPPVE